jgi:hypothetical protein
MNKRADLKYVLSMIVRRLGKSIKLTNLISANKFEVQLN